MYTPFFASDFGSVGLIEIMASCLGAACLLLGLTVIAALVRRLRPLAPWIAWLTWIPTVAGWLVYSLVKGAKFNLVVLLVASPALAAMVVRHFALKRLEKDHKD